MSDNPAQTPEQPRTFPTGHDPMLQIIVRMAEAEVTTSVTVFLPGQVVEGKAISSKTYRRHLISQLAEGMANGAATARRRGEADLAVAMEREQASLLERLTTEPALTDGPANPWDATSVRSFLHLGDASVRAGEVIHAVPVLRIDVTAISAWTLGTSS